MLFRPPSDDKCWCWVYQRSSTHSQDCPLNPDTGLRALNLHAHPQGHLLAKTRSAQMDSMGGRAGCAQEPAEKGALFEAKTQGTGFNCLAYFLGFPSSSPSLPTLEKSRPLQSGMPTPDLGGTRSALMPLAEAETMALHPAGSTGRRQLSTEASHAPRRSHALSGKEELNLKTSKGRKSSSCLGAVCQG